MKKFDAAHRQQLPTGEGQDVATAVLAYIHKQVNFHAAKSAIREAGEGSSIGSDVAKILTFVGDDIEARVRSGERKYGVRLRAHNGRNALLDLYQEILDGVNYAQQIALEGNMQIGQLMISLVDTAVVIRRALAEQEKGII